MLKKSVGGTKATARANKNKMFKPDDIQTCFSDLDRKKYNYYLKQLEETKMASQLVSAPFTDQQFPAELKSLTKNLAKFQKAQKYVWLRADEMFKQQKYEIFQHLIEPSDIKQGKLFGSPLAGRAARAGTATHRKPRTSF